MLQPDRRAAANADVKAFDRIGMPFSRTPFKLTKQ